MPRVDAGHEAKFPFSRKKIIANHFLNPFINFVSGFAFLNIPLTKAAFLV